MIQNLRRLLKWLPAIQKILTTLLDVIQDLADDGARNGSNAKRGGKTAEQKNG